MAVDVCYDGDAALERAMTHRYDVVILDRDLPLVHGDEVCRAIVASGGETRVLMLTAAAGIRDRVDGLDLGADDYLTKPFAFSELLARLQALIRRATHVAEPTTLAAGDLSMNLLTREVFRAGQKIDLQSREFALLELLMRHPGRPITKTMILEHIWDYSFDPQTNVVDVLAHRLRSKLEKGFPSKIVHTIRGVGYVIKPP